MRRRQRQAEKRERPADHLIVHTDFGDSIQIIGSEENWPLFAATFGSLDVVRETLEQIRPIRYDTTRPIPGALAPRICWCWSQTEPGCCHGSHRAEPVLLLASCVPVRMTRTNSRADDRPLPAANPSTDRPFMSQSPTSRTFLFISDSAGDAATSRLAVAGIPYLKRKLESGAANWNSICGLFDEADLIAVLVKLTTRTMRLMISPDYHESAEELLRRIALLPNMVFVHTSFFETAAHADDAPILETEDDEWFGAAAHFGSLERDERTRVMEMIERHGIELMPYRRNVELSVLAAQFVDDHRQNLVFRVYIPQGRLWADQAGDLLDLFRDYLTKAIGLHVRASSHSSPAGTTYEFYVDGETTPEAMASRLPGFTRAMDLCVRDPDRAETLLIEQGADAAEVSRLVTHYRRRMKRIATDTRHERENKVLALRHQLENDLESVAEDASPEIIAMLVDQLTPVAEHAPGLLLGLVDTSRSTAGANVVVNYRPQIFSHVQGIVAQEVSGTQNFGTDAMQILDLTQSLDVHSLADE